MSLSNKLFLVNYKRQEYVSSGGESFRKTIWICTDWNRHWEFQPEQQTLEITGNGTGFNPRDQAWSLDNLMKTAVLWLLCVYCVKKLGKTAIGDTWYHHKA